MDKQEISMYAGKVWHLLFDNAKWTYNELKRKTGLNDLELGAALGWLARENKVAFYADGDEIHVTMSINVYIG